MFHLFGNIALICFRFASFDIIYICAFFILVCYDCAGHLFHVLNDLLLELPFAVSRKGFGIVKKYETASCKLALLDYGAFCKHHGYHAILYVNWKQFFAQKHYEKKEISLQARIGFSQN